jgi:hypothetical protein
MIKMENCIICNDELTYVEVQTGRYKCLYCLKSEGDIHSLAHEAYRHAIIKSNRWARFPKDQFQSQEQIEEILGLDHYVWGHCSQKFVLRMCD